MKNTLILLAVAVAAIACSRQEPYTDPAPAAETDRPAIIVSERSPEYPLTDYSSLHAALSSHHSRQAAAAIALGDITGRSFRLDYYPIEDNRNIGYPVIDMEAYADEYPDRVSRTPILISQANSYSYANFERMVSKTGSDDKMTMGTNVNIAGAFSSASESSYEEIFSDFNASSDKVVYGESSVHWLANRFEMMLPPEGSEGLREYIKPDFFNYVYGLTPENLYDYFGPFLITGFISGARATALFIASEEYSESISARETHMESLISASVNIAGSGGGVSFGCQSENSSEDTYESSFSENSFSIRTYGGLPAYTQFTPPKSVDMAFFDLTAWCGSLQDEQNHTISQIPDNSLLLLSELIDEDNLKERFDMAVAEGGASGLGIMEPYILLDNSGYPGSDVLAMYQCSSYLITRYNETILLASYFWGTDVDFTRLESNRLKRQFPGIEIRYAPQVADGNSKSRNAVVDSLQGGTITEYIPYNISDSDFDMSRMTKFTDPGTGKVYLFPEIIVNGRPSTKKIAYTVYNEDVMNDYTFKNTVGRLDERTDITLDEIREEYRLIAL